MNKLPKQPLSGVDLPPVMPTVGTSQPVIEPQQLIKIKKDAEQNAQARLLLIQLQWLIIILMIGAMIWQYHSQKQLAEQIDNRLKQTESFTTRMNDIDDRIFAMTPSRVITPDGKDASDDLVLVKLLVYTAQRMHIAGDYDGATQILQGVLYGITSNQYNLAVPLSVSLKTALQEDIQKITTAKTQEDAWQSHIFAMKAVQNFLQQSMTADDTTAHHAHTHDAMIYLNLAIGSANARQKDAMTHYLTQTNTALMALTTPSQNQNMPNVSTQDLSIQKPSTKDKSSVNVDNITSFDDVVYTINQLLANPPKSVKLASVAVL